MAEGIRALKIFKQEKEIKGVIGLLAHLSDYSQWYEDGWADRFNKKKAVSKWNVRANRILNFISKDVDNSKEYFTIWLCEQKPKVQYCTLELLSRFTDRETQNGNSKNEYNPSTIDLVSNLYSSLLKSYFVVDKDNPDLVSEERTKQFADESIFFLDIYPLSIEKAWDKLLNNFESNAVLINSILNSEKYTYKHFSFLLACLKSEFARHQYIIKHKDILLRLKAIDEKDIHIF